MQKIISTILLIIFLFVGCSVLKTVENFSRLKYKIHSSTDYQILGINIKEKKSLNDFSSFEMLKLTTGLLKGTLPLSFTLNVETKNPNDGSGGYPKTDLSIESFPWHLLLNDKEVLNGNIPQPILVPGKGESTLIPLRIEFDIAKNFKEKNIDDILFLVLQMGGLKGSTSNLKLITRPVVGTPMGSIEYPNNITIIDKTYN
ncbi:MAG: LEA type 2 family protein [Ignavibacteria bacterium]|nr:LEA type 2 family protein [Ignavibacteria bacterium]